MSKNNLYKVSCPGTIVITGEHAVLYGASAVLCAINKRISLSLSKRDDQLIIIKSDHMFFKVQISEIEILDEYKILTSTLSFYKESLNSGFQIVINSDLPISKGLGSSTAFIVALVAVIKLFIHQNLIANKLDQKIFLKENTDNIFSEVKHILSGALKEASSYGDVAVSIQGGIILYQNQVIKKHIFKQLNIALIYSGYKKHTHDVLSYIKPIRQNYINIFKNLESAIDHISNLAFQAIENENISLLGDLMNINQGILDSMMVSTPMINYIINRLREYPFVKGAKISGSGLGDSVLCVFSDQKKLLATDLQNIAIPDIMISNLGLEIE